MAGKQPDSSLALLPSSYSVLIYDSFLAVWNAENFSHHAGPSFVSWLLKTRSSWGTAPVSDTAAEPREACRSAVNNHRNLRVSQNPLSLAANQ